MSWHIMSRVEVLEIVAACRANPVQLLPWQRDFLEQIEDFAERFGADDLPIARQELERLERIEHRIGVDAYELMRMADSPLESNRARAQAREALAEMNRLAGCGKLVLKSAEI